MGTILKVAVGIIVGVWLLTHLFSFRVTVKPGTPAGAPAVVMVI